MNIGIPRETSVEENRVAITPAGVYELNKENHTVYIETKCGISSGFSDDDYENVGGQLLYSHDEIFGRSDIVGKVEPPTEAEVNMMVDGQTLVSMLHLGMRSARNLYKLQEKNITAFGYELMKAQAHQHSVLDAMGGIAGAMLPQIAGHFLELQNGGRGVLLSAQPGIPAASVVILGAGHIGTCAMKAFLGLGAQVIMLDRDIYRLRMVHDMTGKRVVTELATPYNIEKAIRFADVFIGAVFIRGEKPPRLVTHDMIREMKKGAVVMDISIDQGGCIETSRPTTHSDPVFVVDGVIHYCVPNIPSAVPRTSSHALSNVVFPYVLELANVLNTQPIDPKTTQDGLYLHKGKYTDETLKRIFQ